MKIAIHAADLDHDRIDGTRVYILSLLRRFGKLSSGDDFFIYHKTKFNPHLVPPRLGNYFIKPLGKFFAWTHTRFAWEIFCQKPEVLWMPLHNLPFFRRKNLKSVVTIHDLAFKFFPEYFTRKDLFKLNLLADHAIKKADRIIAISASTKKDILSLYPQVAEENISVVHHGFDAELFQKEIPQEESKKILSKFGIFNSKFILYVGAIQPRKNLIVLIEAFEKIKEKNPDLKLVLAGAPAWKHGQTLKRIKESRYGSDIIITGTIPFSYQPVFYRNASVFVFPSLYEGFGIPVLEAFASGTPAILADNSSLPEVGGEAALYFEAGDSYALAGQIGRILEDDALAGELREKGKKRVGEFSWEKCAGETLAIIKKM